MPVDLSSLLIAILALTLIILFAVCFHHWDVVPVKRRIVARLKSTSEPSDTDVKRVGFMFLICHRVSWPVEWTTPEQANERGSELLNELWPDELPLPASSGRLRWSQRTRKVR